MISTWVSQAYIGIEPTPMELEQWYCQATLKEKQAVKNPLMVDRRGSSPVTTLSW